MLSSLRNMFRVPDLRNKILFTLLMLAVYRFRRPSARARCRLLGAVQELEKQAGPGGAACSAS